MWRRTKEQRWQSLLKSSKETISIVLTESQKSSISKIHRSSSSMTGRNPFENQGFGMFPEASHTRHLVDLLGAGNETSTNQPRRLSLSLGSCFLQKTMNSDLISPHYTLPGEEPRDRYDYGYSLMESSSAPCFSIVGSSRYLKPAQSLLEETVNVGGRDIIGLRRLSTDLKAKLCNTHNSDKQELQVRIAQLVSLLEEVEGRYAKYCHQMEEVEAPFEAVAGLGSAKTYTAQALQAMSRHFCSLRDAIVSQISLMRRKASRELPRVNVGLSRLSLFDGEIRHSRMNLHQTGMIQNQGQAWRPIRGLPDTSVAVLRSWLLEHFLHPYPNDSEKLMLSSQTGLTKNQVSNWFINARVRLWKPMIEEIYREEFGDSSEESNRVCAADD